MPPHYMEAMLYNVKFTLKRMERAEQNLSLLTPNFSSNHLLVEGWFVSYMIPPNSFIHNQNNCKHQASMGVYM